MSLAWAALPACLDVFLPEVYSAVWGWLVLKNRGEKERKRRRRRASGDGWSEIFRPRVLIKTKDLFPGTCGRVFF